MNEIDVNIASNLTTLESKVFNVLEKVRQKRAPGTVLRVVGGWVRDKLLNQPSDDIDLMVDNMSGAEFANLIVEELGLEKAPHVIQENPEKTKNIEAAKMHIPIDGQDVELDFVQARTEEYGDNRREVTTRPATAEEDAMRRDLTIGALFYNLNERKVEDFTGKGIKDLITGTIRTPYDAGDESSVEEVKKTFIEDPLRVFRAIRFAAKYGGNISPSTFAAIQDPEVINAIFFSERKIATERIGQEFMKTMKGPNPALGLKLLKDTGLMQHILNESIKGSQYEGGMEELDMEQNNPHHELTVWDHTYQVLQNSLEYFPQEDEEKRVIQVLAALTHDLGKLYRDIHGESASHPGTTSYHGHEKESKVICDLLFKYLKIEGSLAKQVAGLARYHMQPHNLGRGEGNIGAMRKFIRRMGEESLNWLDVFNLAVADAYSKTKAVDPKVIEKYEGFRAKMEEALATMTMNEDKVVPVLNGHQIMETLGTKGGPHMSLVQNYLKDLVDEYPEMTTEEAIGRLQEIRSRAEALIAEREDINTPQDAISFVLQDIAGNVTASSDGVRRIIEATACPQHLFQKKHTDVQKLVQANKFIEALATLKEFHKDYIEDDKVARMTIIALFNILSKEPKLRDNDLLQYALDRTEHSMFDPVLTSYATGLLVLLKTVTKPDAIIQIGEGMAKMNPGILRSVLDALPKEVYHDDIRQKLKAAVDENL